MFKRIINLRSQKKIYHKEGCPYLKRVPGKFKSWVDIDDSNYRGYRACKYCEGNRGWARIFHRRGWRMKIERWADCFYDDFTGNLYIRTDAGFWKLVWKAEKQDFMLFHLNKFEKNRSIKSMMKDRFHKQSDVKPTASFDSLVDYIVAHDRSRMMYKSHKEMPSRTKQQKKYRKQAEKRERRQANRRIDELFDQIARK